MNQNAERRLVERGAWNDVSEPFGRLRLAYLTNISSPYRIDMIEAWARLNPQLFISVYYTDAGDQGRGWTTRPMSGVAECKLPILADIPSYGKINRNLVDLVRQNDVIMIGGFEQASYLYAALLARLLGKPVILLFDGFSPARFEVEPSAVRVLKRITASLCNSFFANGRVGRIYLENHIRVAPGKPIYNQFLSHSDKHIAEARTHVIGMEKTAIRARLGIETERMVLMCCGYLIQRKRIDLIISAISHLPVSSRPLLLVVGMGPLADTLALQAKTSGVPIHFAGFKQQLELAIHYFAADALVLASEDDPWGLVVNEAMSAGLPVIVSDACGAALDLVHEGVNGFVFQNRNNVALSKAIERLFDSDLPAMGAASKKMIKDWTAEHSALNLGRCVNDAILLKSSR